jgi:hypothetical protein
MARERITGAQLNHAVLAEAFGCGWLFQLILSERILVKIFDFCPGPWGLPKELQTGLHRGVIRKTPDPDMGSQLVPAIALGEVCDDPFQGQSM